MTALHFECATNAVVLGLCTLTAYNWPKRAPVMMSSPSGDLTRTLPLPILKHAPLSSSLEREIRLDLISGVCNAFSNFTFLLIPFISVIISIFPFSIIENVAPLLANNPTDGCSSALYVMKRDLSAKQWSLAPKSIKMSQSDE